jgi:hypothetical protein
MQRVSYRRYLGTSRAKSAAASGHRNHAVNNVADSRGRSCARLWTRRSHWPALAGNAVFFTRKSHAAVGDPRKIMILNEQEPGVPILAQPLDQLQVVASHAGSTTLLRRPWLRTCRGETVSWGYPGSRVRSRTYLECPSWSWPPPPVNKIL